MQVSELTFSFFDSPRKQNETQSDISHGKTALVVFFHLGALREFQFLYLNSFSLTISDESSLGTHLALQSEKTAHDRETMVPVLQKKNASRRRSRTDRQIFSFLSFYFSFFDSLQMSSKIETKARAVRYG